MNFDQLDIRRLGRYLENEICGFQGLQRAEKFSGGQSNPTYLLTANTGQYVLRRQPFGKLLKSAHAVDREFRVIDTLSSSAVPVAKAYHLCEDMDVLGSKFYVMSFENGRIFWNPALPEFPIGARISIYNEMSRILAALHDIDVQKAGLADFGRPGNYFERQISRWTKQYLASETAKIIEMEQLIKWLPSNLPKDDGKVSLIHGDFRLDNIIFSSTGTDAIALLDWELSTLGHPFSDLAYQCMQLRMPTDAVIAGLGDLDRASLGIPTEEQYVQTYCEHRGLSEVPNWNFYIVLSFFRFAAILQGVLKRAVEGNASSNKALEYGALAPKLARMALDVVEAG